MMSKLNARALTLALAMTAAGFASAQSPTANIAGQAKPDDVITIQNVDTGFTREVKPKDNGRYQLRNLPIGNFSVTVKHADGTSDAPKIVSLRVGSTARVQ
jgi:hypothetical protein